MPALRIQARPRPRTGHQDPGPEGRRQLRRALESLMNELGAAGWTYMRARNTAGRRNAADLTFAHHDLPQPPGVPAPRARDAARRRSRPDTTRKDRAGTRNRTFQPRRSPAWRPRSPGTGRPAQTRPDPAHDTEDDPSFFGANVCRRQAIPIPTGTTPGETLGVDAQRQRVDSRLHQLAPQRRMHRAVPALARARWRVSRLQAGQTRARFAITTLVMALPALLIAAVAAVLLALVHHLQQPRLERPPAAAPRVFSQRPVRSRGFALLASSPCRPKL